MSVATPDASFGHAIHTLPPSAMMRLATDSRRLRSARVFTKSMTRSARPRAWRRVTACGCAPPYRAHRRRKRSGPHGWPYAGESIFRCRGLERGASLNRSRRLRVASLGVCSGRRRSARRPLRRRAVGIGCDPDCGARGEPQAPHRRCRYGVTQSTLALPWVAGPARPYTPVGTYHP